ncbi:flagellar biosynthetic protein FliR [Alkalibacterium sp. 20]|uniref:flagellar biosynthetic protein FliR n=1 Tax=Alkalibacterium sp. 20 TaxID=1798803 RepID=UPI0009002E8E|nr:flagellar biosynthetic protein FliR [Alkalibacterium sp. 20]OJF90888.1 flagellar biosynthetic protein FliR [Alkalibacterium sp. 20]
MTADIQQFLLILIRLTVFITVSPGFSHKSFPAASKIALSVGLALPVMVTVNAFDAEISMALFLTIAVKEVLIGLALGYITLLFFTAFEIAGAFVDFQVGFSMGQIYDPALGVNASYYGRVYYWISMMIFFIANIHHQVIRSLVKSFEWAPLEQLSFSHFGMEGMIHLFSHMFATAVQLAIPLIIVAILSELTLALISRTVPQINVLILGMPMKIVVSLVFMFFFLSLLMRNIGDVFPDMIKYMNEWLYGLQN